MKKLFFLLLGLHILTFCVAQKNQYLRGDNIFLQNGAGTLTRVKFDSTGKVYFPNNTEVYTNKQLGIYSKGYVTSVYSGIVLDSFLYTSEVRNGSALRTIVNQYPHNWFVSAYNNGFKNGITIDTSTSYALKITTSVGEYTLPRNTPSAGQVLGAVDGSGNLVWGNVCTGKVNLADSNTVYTTPYYVSTHGLPSQTGNAGKFLTTDGSAASWSDRFFADGTNTKIKSANGDDLFVDDGFGGVTIYGQGAASSIITDGSTSAVLAGSNAFSVSILNGITINSSNGSNSHGAFIKTDSLTANRTYQFPDESGTLAVKRYKSYVALLTQTGTGAPVATVLENDLGGTVVWTRAGAGIYEATLSGAFTTNKTLVFIGDTFQESVGSARYQIIDTGKISFTTYSGGSDWDDEFGGTPVEIRVYY